MQDDVSNSINGTVISGDLVTLADIQNGNGTNPNIEFQSLQYSLFTTVFVQILGGLFFLATACYIIDDKKDCDVMISQSSGESIDDSNANTNSQEINTSEGNTDTDDDDDGTTSTES